MYKKKIREQLQELISLAKQRSSTVYIAIIASTQDHSEKWADYDLHSVKTSYLARHELEEIIASFREYSAYLEVYTDIEDFLKALYTDLVRFIPS
mgnify:FL=1